MVVDAILDAIELATQLGLPAHDASSYSVEENEAFGLHQFPYGANLAISIAVVRDEAIMKALPEEMKALFEAMPAPDAPDSTGPTEQKA